MQLVPWPSSRRPWPTGPSAVERKPVAKNPWAARSDSLSAHRAPLLTWRSRARTGACALMVANGYVWRRELPQATELMTASKLEMVRITANIVGAAARSRQLPALEHREVVYCAAAELRKKPAAQVSQPVVCADEERRLARVDSLETPPAVVVLVGFSGDDEETV